MRRDGLAISGDVAMTERRRVALPYPARRSVPPILDNVIGSGPFRGMQNAAVVPADEAHRLALHAVGRAIRSASHRRRLTATAQAQATGIRLYHVGETSCIVSVRELDRLALDVPSPLIRPLGYRRGFSAPTLAVAERN